MLIEVGISDVFDAIKNEDDFDPAQLAELVVESVHDNADEILKVVVPLIQKLLPLQLRKLEKIIKEELPE